MPPPYMVGVRTGPGKSGRLGNFCPGHGKQYNSTFANMCTSDQHTIPDC